MGLAECQSQLRGETCHEPLEAFHTLGPYILGHVIPNLVSMIVYKQFCVISSKGDKHNCINKSTDYIFWREENYCRDKSVVF